MAKVQQTYGMTTSMAARACEYGMASRQEKKKKIKKKINKSLKDKTTSNHLHCARFQHVNHRYSDKQRRSSRCRSQAMQDDVKTPNNEKKKKKKKKKQEATEDLAAMPKTTTVTITRSEDSSRG